MTTNRNASFAGEVAFVTGAASGIGRAAALAFAREGASVVAADVSEHDNQETARLIDEQGGRAVSVRCDVTRAEDVQAAMAKTVEAFGRLDFAFNNAGIEPRKPAPTADYDEEEWNRILDINLRFPVHEARDPADPQAGRRRDREHLIGCGSYRHQGQPGIHGREARRDRPHTGGGARLRAQNPHQRRVSWIHRYADDESLHWGHRKGARR
jgi:NAD(P)-dependent dehydrogenase (short-subunit alcohol dehydrogenase family)